MRQGRLRLVVGLVVVCFCTGTIQADEHGIIYGWGNDDYGQATVPEGSDFVAISAGYGHSLALKSDGSIVGWGLNDDGEATVPVGNDFVAIAAGYWHSLALKSDGSIVGWGWDYYDQASPPVGNDYVAISAGYYHSLALKLDGSLVGWGKDDYGQASPPVGNDYVAIAAGREYSLALKSDGSIVGWGRDDYGQATAPAGNDFVAIAAGSSHSLAMKSDGSIVGWGYDSYGQATAPVGNDFVAIAAGGAYSLALKLDGSIVGWGYDGDGRATPVEGTGFFAIAAGGEHSLAISSEVLLVGWGSNYDYNNYFYYYGQATVPPGNDYVAIAAGAFHSLALKSDGTLVGWGNNDNGQATVPVGNDYVAIAAGSYHNLALKLDGTLVGWGNDTSGETTVPEGNDFVAIAAGCMHSLALKSDGTLAEWGYDWSDQATPTGNDFIAIAAGMAHNLALKSDGSIVAWGIDWGDEAPPVGNDFVAICAGDVHSLALKSDGSIVGWGWDIYGQATVPPGNDYVAIAAGGYHSLALKSDGSIVGWGSNYNFPGGIYYGQATPPVGNDFVGIAAGSYHSLAIRNLPGDVNIDWQVDLVDFGIVSGGWMEVGCDGDNNFCSGADIDRMGDVGLDDLFMLAGNWLAGVPFPTAAFGPYPDDGISGVNPDTGLSWSAGVGAVSHNIYFGTSSPGVFQTNQGGTTFDPGPLDCETMYYWRIDEVQAGSSVIEGDVWRFTTIPPGSAFGPNPDDGTSGVNLDTELSWSAGECAVSHNIYFGTVSPGEFQTNQGGTTFDPGPLDCQRTYYWRIDEVGADSSVIEGDVWRFTTIPTGPAFGPNPDDGRSGVNPDTELSWSGGGCAISHNIYFGTSSPGEFQTNQAGTTFDPGPLDCQRTYYWRIDEVQADSSVIEGDVWRFTTRSDMLVGWWKLDESEGGTAYDSAEGHDGTLNGDPTWRPSGGQIGGALEFDGVGDYVEVAVDDSINDIETITMAAWVKADNVDRSTAMTILSREMTDMSTYCLKIKKFNRWYAQIRLDGSEDTARFVYASNATTDWTHIGATYDGSCLKLYVNGNLKGTTNVAGTIDTDNPRKLRIGRNAGVNVYFDGLLDDVRIYNYALSEEEIGALAGVL